MLLAYIRGSKLRTYIDNFYKNKEFSAATFKSHYTNFLIRK